MTPSHPLTVASEVMPGKLDTGADVTAIPISLAAQLGLQLAGRAWVRGFDGSYARRLVYYPWLATEGHELNAVRCVATDRAIILLGRNVLNRFVVVLNGPGLRFEIRAP